MTIFNPKSSEAEVLEAMKYMVGNSADVGAVLKIIKPCRAPAAAAIERIAAESRGPSGSGPSAAE